MNITKAFGEYMEDQNFGTLGTNIFIGAIPKDAPQSCWMIASAGGNITKTSTTGERMKSYIILAYYRSINPENVYETMQSFEENINSSESLSLSGYDTITAQCSVFPSDQDIDSEERTKAMAQVALTIYL